MAGSAAVQVLHFALPLYFVVLAALLAPLVHCRSTPWDNYNYASPDVNPSTETYDPVTFSTWSSETVAEGSPDVRSYDTYTESPETGSSDSSTFAVDRSITENAFDKEKYSDNEYIPETFYDTSLADTIYKASDANVTELSLASYNATNTDDMLLSLKKALGGCGTGNPIDDCWRCDPNWQSHRQALASCAIGFGRNAIGGKNGRIYVVTTNGDDAQNPAPGTLRYGVTRSEPLWITFANSMTIQLKAELIMTSYKTIDGRGATVHIVGGSQITIEGISHVIVHGIHIHDIRPSGPSTILASPSNLVHRGVSDGDGVHILSADNVWIDHCYLANAADGLIDATHGSTMITISNNYFTNHNKVMLFGSHPTDVGDRNMQITVAYNKFGPGLVQRLPRCRFGNFHIVNNDYSAGWGIYAIGGSEDPTILSEGNYFNPVGSNKEVTKRINDNGPAYGGCQSWNWASSGDIFLGGAYFTGSGATASSAGVYAKAFSFSPRPGQLVPALTAGAGPLSM